MLGNAHRMPAAAGHLDRFVRGRGLEQGWWQRVRLVGGGPINIKALATGRRDRVVDDASSLPFVHPFLEQPVRASVWVAPARWIDFPNSDGGAADYFHRYALRYGATHPHHLQNGCIWRQRPPVSLVSIAKSIQKQTESW